MPGLHPARNRGRGRPGLHNPNGPGRVVVPADAEEAFVIERALADEKVKTAIAGKQIVKKIYAPGKLLNLVVKGRFGPSFQIRMSVVTVVTWVIGQ